MQEHGITEEELKQAKVNFRSSFLENLESRSGFGRADLLAALALYDDDPNRINTILADLDKVTTAEVQQAAKKYLVPSNRTSIDRRPEGGAQVRVLGAKCCVQVLGCWRASCIVLAVALTASAQTERPGRWPERPFQLAPRRRADAAQRASRHRHAPDGDPEGLRSP